jgi:hypothetical protein
VLAYFAMAIRYAGIRFFSIFTNNLLSCSVQASVLFHSARAVSYDRKMFIALVPDYSPLIGKSLFLLKMKSTVNRW